MTYKWWLERGCKIDFSDPRLRAMNDLCNFIDTESRSLESYRISCERAQSIREECWHAIDMLISAICELEIADQHYALTLRGTSNQRTGCKPKIRKQQERNNKVVGMVAVPTITHLNDLRNLLEGHSHLLQDLSAISQGRAEELREQFRAAFRVLIRAIEEFKAVDKSL